jgi:hypothetical protein
MVTLVSIILFGTSIYENIGVISAMDAELGYIKQHMQTECVDTISRRIFASGMINGVKCVLVMAGVGKVNAVITAETPGSLKGVRRDHHPASWFCPRVDRINLADIMFERR